MQDFSPNGYVGEPDEFEVYNGYLITIRCGSQEQNQFTTRWAVETLEHPGPAIDGDPIVDTVYQRREALRRARCHIDELNQHISN